MSNIKTALGIIRDTWRELGKCLEPDPVTREHDDISRMAWQLGIDETDEFVKIVRHYSLCKNVE